MNNELQKKVIIFSYGPVPIEGQDKVEGGGLRCWGLAKGILAQNRDIEVTVAYKREYAKEKQVTEFEGIKIATWAEGEVEQLMTNYDTVIVSYCMGALSSEVAKHISSGQQLVLDCYVPIYVEISARHSDDLDTEYRAFQHEVKNWDAILRKGDLFLCANENQKRYYQGVLSAVGRINPATYDDELILVVPYGVYREKPVAKTKPITELLKKSGTEKYRKILWFGAIYPWFDLRNLLEAITILNKKIPTKLVIVGAKNPFNNHPDFVARYEQIMTFISDSPDHSKNTLIQDWIDFNDRADWYLDSDMVILVNKLGEENELSWRTRLVDYVWADLPILTNGGDPLSEKLLENDAAVIFEDKSAESIAKQLEAILMTGDRLKNVKKNIAKVRSELYWDKVAQKLGDYIESHKKAQDFMQFGEYELSTNFSTKNPVELIKKVARKAKRIPAYYKKHGARTTYYTLRTTFLNQGRRVGLDPQNGSPRIVFVSHQLDMTGAPLVFMDLMKDFRQRYKNIPLELHTFAPVRNENVRTVNKLGIKPKIHMSRDMSLPYHKGDVVVLNTVAYSETFMNGIFASLRNGRVKHLHWYVHEDEPEYIFKKHLQGEIKELLSNNKISIYIPAKRSTANYQQFFGDAKNIKVQYYRLDIPEGTEGDKSEDDFDKLKFILPGMVGDGRKGQLPLFYAFSAFKKEYYDKHPEKYRDFTLTYIGMMDDFYSRQLEKHELSALGSHFLHFPQLDHDRTLALIKDSNITLCYSMRECLPIFVFEGMMAGHPILRNDCSGVEEQLVEGPKGNGVPLDSHNFYQIVEVLETLLNKEKTNNQEFYRMSRVSKNIAEKYSTKNFDDIIAAISDSWTS